LKEKTSLIKEYFFYVQLNKKEMKDITLFTWTKLGLIPTMQHPISGHHLTPSLNHFCISPFLVADVSVLVPSFITLCNQVENKIEPQYWKSDHIIEEIPKIIINLDILSCKKHGRKYY
jgi:hypothetical protein